MTEACAETLAKTVGASFIHVLGRFKEFQTSSRARMPTVLDYIMIFDIMMSHYDVRTRTGELRGRIRRDKLDEAVSTGVVNGHLHDVLRGCRRNWQAYGRMNANWTYHCQSMHHRGPNYNVADELFHQHLYNSRRQRPGPSETRA